MAETMTKIAALCASSAPATLLGRLAQDSAGNTLAIMAAMLLPMTALAGSTVDAARLYLVKVRLQQACDAGVLAARRYMTDSADPNLDANTINEAGKFFRNNFTNGWLSTSNVVFTPTKTNVNRVSGTATANVPMLLMRMFGFATQTVSVSCQARFDVADTDIIFVLDTTGSMACVPSRSDSDCTTYVNGAGTVAYTRPNDSALGQSGAGLSVNDSVAGYPGSGGFYVPEEAGSRIAALRQAVKDFYTTMAANVQPGTNIRYGFVTYTSTVNAGKAIMSLNPQYMVGGGGGGTTVNYQTRRITGESSSNSSTTYTSTSQTTCNTYIQARTPAGVGNYSQTTLNATARTVSWTTSNGGRCVVTTTTYVPVWTYAQAPQDVSALLTNVSVDDPTRISNATTRWQGCIEERPTTPNVTTFDLDNLPADLDPNLIPTSDATRWRPLWPDVIWGRNNGTSTGTTTSNGEPTNTSQGYSYTAYNNQSFLKGGAISCGKPVRRLATMSFNDVSNYVDASDFRPIGGTYHDVGMIWGTRLLSPSGPFAADTAAWPGRTAPNRVIVFLTDGDMKPGASVYGLYGVEIFDRRVTGGNYTDANTYKNYHNQRFLAECNKAKSRLNINVWTVTIGPAVTDEMRSCASNDNQALFTQNGNDLAAQFRSIAEHVARLRLSQ